MSGDGREEHPGEGEQHVQGQGDVLAELRSPLRTTRGLIWGGRKARRP